MRRAALLLLLVSVSTPATAQSTMAFGASRKDRPARSYQALFDAQAAARQLQPQGQAPADSAAAPKRRTVCGLTVIEVDKSVDPKIVIGPKDGELARQAARQVPPSFWAFCGGAKTPNP